MKCKYKFDALKTAISCFFRPRQKWLTDKITKHWCDKPELIETVLYEILVNYVEGEKCFEVISWEHEKYKIVATFIRECYDWIKVGRPKLVKEIDGIIQAAPSWLDRKNITLTYNETYPGLTALEEKLAESDQYYLRGIVKYKDYLWT